jgi:ferrous iron transport protein A
MLLATSYYLLMRMNLKNIKVGQKIEITLIPQELKDELLRLGISAGEVLTCISTIPGGPVILQQELQELAIGENFSKKIECKLVS